MSKVAENKALSRVSFLAEQYNVLSVEEFDNLLETNEVSDNDELISTYMDGEPLAMVSSLIKKESTFEGNLVTSYKKVIKIHENVFINMVQADPTDNKIYLQWMLTVFTKFIKEGDFSSAIRFANEDLMLANEYLTLFEANKRKQLFKTLCRANSELLNIHDPTNINQYKNLGQVFDVIDPFIERDPSNLEIAMKRFVDAGAAEIPVRDRNFTVYIPISEKASEILSKFTNWCTTRVSNGMVKTYTNMKTPAGKKSKLYVIIDNNFFLGESDNLWQIHFESSQIMDRSDRPERDIYGKVLEKSEILSKFFYNELIVNARLEQLTLANTQKKNKYLEYLVNFGHPEARFDVFNDNVVSLTFADELIPRVPDLSRFKSVDLIHIMNCKLKELHKSITSLKNLQTLSISHNKIEELPNFIGDCKNLVFINLTGNKIKYIPNDIGKLDPSNGGSLVMMSLKTEDVGEENFNKLKKLLPNVEINISM